MDLPVHHERRETLKMSLESNRETKEEEGLEDVTVITVASSVDCSLL